jgi:hypothetical protein
MQDVTESRNRTTNFFGREARDAKTRSTAEAAGGSLSHEEFFRFDFSFVLLFHSREVIVS